MNKYVLTGDVTLAARTAATVMAAEPGTGGAAGFGGAPTTGGPPWPVTWKRGQEIALDPAGALFTQIGSGNLCQISPAQESGGVLGTAN